jgi:hypothetical protein
MVKPHSVGHLLLVEGADAGRDRAVLEINGVRMIVVAVPDVAQAISVAAELIESEAVALIELDGGFGVAGTAQMIDAIKGAVPVGAVTFGAESLSGIADFIARYQA